MAATSDDLIAVLLVALRIGPTLSFAPPFTLMRIPVLARVLLSLALAASLAGLAAPHAPLEPRLISAVISELLLGVSMALSLQLAFAAIQVAGRVVDFQAGFGLAVLADPTLRSQMPLIGALLSYAAGAVFFATSGPADLFAVWAQSLRAVPIGGFALDGGLANLLSYMSAVFAIALALVGLVLLTLFLADLAIAFASRTLPQMNVLVLGFQIKTIALLATLPLALAVSSALFFRLVRLALSSMLSLP